MPGDIYEEICRELVRLRHGRAVQTASLKSRLGPLLAAACGVRDEDTNEQVRGKVGAVLRQLTTAFPHDLQQAITTALAIERTAAPKLTDRVVWLAEQLNCTDRTARRRVDDACARLAEALHHHYLQQDQPPDPEQGWRVSHLNALLRLDSPSPELYEERTIMATQAGLAQIRTRVSLPRAQGSEQGRHSLVAKVLYGATLRHEERLGRTHYRHTLALPRPLRQAEQVSYKIMYGIPRQRMLPHYAFVPLTPCDSMQVRVRFDPRRPPHLVWLLDRVAPRQVDEQDPGAVQLTLDTACEVSQSFVNLVQGLGYGVAWRPSGQ